MSKSMYALSIAGRLTLEMHSLNNEGGEGNQTTTRMVTIVDNEGKVQTVNAISGDMFKHIHAEHLQRLAKSQNQPLCAGCVQFSASRILDDKAFMSKLAKHDSQVADDMAKKCVVCDGEGILIAKGNRSIARKSVAEFGWVVGLPGTKTDSYFHVRYAKERGEDTSQPIFHRPASSGRYAVATSLEIARIGLNDIIQTYPITDEQRLTRHKLMLESTLHTFIHPAGAMRSTQYPHIHTFEGVVSVSYDIAPAPLLSSLNDSYQDETERIAKALSDRVEVHRFASMGQFAEIMRQLINSTEPYKLFAS